VFAAAQQQQAIADAGPTRSATIGRQTSLARPHSRCTRVVVARAQLPPAATGLLPRARPEIRLVLRLLLVRLTWQAANSITSSR
jgi:hypothetical protein